MNDGDFLSPSRKHSSFFKRMAFRRLRLSAFSVLAAPLFFSFLALPSKPAFSQSMANVSEDENHVSLSWVSSLRLDEEDEKTPVLCRLSGNYGQIGLWASKEGLEITSENANWNLPDTSGGAVTIQVHNHFTQEQISANKDDEEGKVTSPPFRGRLTADFQDTFFMLAQNKERMGAAITIERLLPLLAAFEQGESATLRFASKDPESLPLEGAKEAINNFRECAFKNHFADLRSAAEDEKNGLEDNQDAEAPDTEGDRQEIAKVKQNQDPYKDPFSPKAEEDPWPQSSENKQAGAEESDDPNDPNTPNEFSEQPKAPGAPPPPTEEEQAEIDQKRANALQEKERLEEQERERQIEIGESAEAKRLADEREAKRLEQIAAAKQAQQARKERARKKANAQKASIKAKKAADKKAQIAAYKASKKETPLPFSQDEIKSNTLRKQAANVDNEMGQAQSYLNANSKAHAKKGSSKKKNVPARLSSHQIDTARTTLKKQSTVEAVEALKGSQATQNERSENAAITLSQAESFMKSQASQSKDKKVRKASKNLVNELESAQTFLDAQTTVQTKAETGGALTTTQKAHAKNKLPFDGRPPTYSEPIVQKKLSEPKKKK
ncbi:hypothetical protein FAI40_03410 [Acetobacteraceae bacterium]|nr:hypothetical protein FAI40_03410 [Acetobacteraceae bacterium]